MALSLNDLKKSGKTPSAARDVAPARRMLRPWEDPTRETAADQNPIAKQVTNGEQTGNKEVAKQVTNGEQTGNKQVTPLGADSLEIGSQNHKRVTQQVTSTCVNREQTGNKQVTKVSFEHLRGHEARLLQLIFTECQIAGDLLTPPLTLERIAQHLESRKQTAKTVIVRLTKKGLVKRENSATGRGGYTCFRLEKDTYQTLLIRETGNKRITNREQTGNKRDTQRVTERVTDPSSSSSSLDLVNKLTNTEDTENSVDLPSEWIAIDTSPLTAIRFGRPQLVQLSRLGTVSAEQVQESINAFAFDLEVNEKGKGINGHALNYFIGILRKGPYAPPGNYEPPETRQMRLYLEAKERAQKTREELESRLQAVEFDEWVSGLTAEERGRLVPPQEFAKPGSQGHNVQLREYFRETIWPDRREKVLRGEI